VRPYWIRVRGEIAEGDLACEVGHRLRQSDGSVDGIYAGWKWADRTLVIDQDRYGFFPLFEWQSPDARLVSTDLLTLLEQGAPTNVDLDALSVFLRVGFFVGADTPFRAIRAVLPPSIAPRRLHVTRDAAVDGFIDLLNAALSRRLPSGRYEMPLSGGRDSRHILFALHDAGCAPAACVTVRHFPPRANDDELIARELCDTFGIRHRVLEQPRDRAAIERRKNARTHLCTDEHAQFVVLADHLCAHTRETYDGIAGDVLSQSTYLRPAVHALFEREDIRGVAEFVLDGYGTMMSEQALERLLAPELYRQMPRERAVARLTAEIAPHAGAANPIRSFFFNNRTRREIALSPFALMRDITVYAPYLDRELYDFLAALPASLLMDRALHTDAIARAWPQYAHIPYERKGMTIQNRGATRRLAAAVAGTALGPGRGRWLRRGTVIPPLVATMIDGNADRLWAASWLLYLDYIAQTATPVAMAAARDR